MITSGVLSVLVILALILASATPLILITLLIKDWKQGKLW